MRYIPDIDSISFDFVYFLFPLKLEKNKKKIVLSFQLKTTLLLHLIVGLGDLG